jgi:hypothetical protein
MSTTYKQSLRHHIIPQPRVCIECHSFRTTESRCHHDWGVVEVEDIRCGRVFRNLRRRTGNRVKDSLDHKTLEPTELMITFPPPLCWTTLTTKSGGRTEPKISTQQTFVTGVLSDEVIQHEALIDRRCNYSP